MRSATMPSSGLCRIRFVPSWRKSGKSAGTPFCYSALFGIVRYGSQGFEEAQQLIIRAVRSLMGVVFASTFSFKARSASR